MASSEQAQRMVTYLTAHTEQHLFECSWCVEHVRYCQPMLQLLKLKVKWIRRAQEVTPA